MFLLSRALAGVWGLAFYKGVDRLSPSHWIPDTPARTPPGAWPVLCTVRLDQAPGWALQGSGPRRLQPFCPRSYLRKAASCLAAESNIFKDEEISTFLISYCHDKADSVSKNFRSLPKVAGPSPRPAAAPDAPRLLHLGTSRTPMLPFPTQTSRFPASGVFRVTSSR